MNKPTALIPYPIRFTKTTSFSEFAEAVECFSASLKTLLLHTGTLNQSDAPADKGNVYYGSELYTNHSEEIAPVYCVYGYETRGHLEDKKGKMYVVLRHSEGLSLHEFLSFFATQTNFKFPKEAEKGHFDLSLEVFYRNGKIHCREVFSKHTSATQYIATIEEQISKFYQKVIPLLEHCFKVKIEMD